MNFTFFIFLIFFSNYNSVDLGLPTIQAICKIELKNGKSEEGIFLYTRGGYGSTFIPNGFFLKYPNGGSLYLFKLDSRIPDFERIGEAEVFFAKNITNPDLPSQIENNGDSLLTRTSTENFKLLKYFPIYKELPIDLYINQNRGLDNSQINVDEIVKFKILSNPSSNWLELIEKARLDRRKVDETWEDYQEPIWFHELIKDRDKMQSLIKYFPPN